MADLTRAQLVFAQVGGEGRMDSSREESPAVDGNFRVMPRADGHTSPFREGEVQANQVRCAERLVTEASQPNARQRLRELIWH